MACNTVALDEGMCPLGEIMVNGQTLGRCPLGVTLKETQNKAIVPSPSRLTLTLRMPVVRSPCYLLHGLRVWQRKWHHGQAMKNSLKVRLSVRKAMPNPIDVHH